MADDFTRAELLNVFDEAIAPKAGFATETAAFAPDPKKFFCENWPMIKEVLKFLGDKLGGLPGLAVKGLIAVGDVLHGKIC